MQIEKNKSYRAQIVDYTADGAGVARIGGMAVFVPRTVVGDQCDIRITKVGRRFAFGRLERVIVPSHARCTPACAVADRCGGCCFQHLTYEEELRAKQKKVLDALTRIGGLAPDVLRGITGAPSTVRYRNKAQYPVGCDRNGHIVTGFYRPHSHDIVPTDTCLLQSPEADRLAAVVRDWMERHHIPPYDQTTARGTLRHIYVRTGARSGACQLVLISATDKLPALDELIDAARACVPALTGVLINRNTRTDNVIWGDKTTVLWGQATLEDRLCGHTFTIHPAAFYQVNPAQAERLYQCAVDLAAQGTIHTVVELYCGAGTISLALAAHAQQVIGVECVPEAVENARANAARNHISNVRFVCADAGQAAHQLVREGVHPDVLVVDPPRRGMDTLTRDAILLLRPARLVYVSCDPATLARDVRELCGTGYRAEQAHAFDLFPRTAHVECVVLMTKERVI